MGEGERMIAIDYDLFYKRLKDDFPEAIAIWKQKGRKSRYIWLKLPYAMIVINWGNEL